MDRNPSSSSKRDRKTVEKERRNEMKALYSQLSSLVPYQSDKEVVSLTDRIDAAANYIKKLQETIEKNRQKKNNLIRRGCSNPSSSCEISPRIEIRLTGPALEVVLVTWIANCQFMFSETLRILHEEEGLEVETASFSVVGNVVFHTIHSKIGESALEHGAASRYPRDSGDLCVMLIRAETCTVIETLRSILLCFKQ